MNEELQKQLADVLESGKDVGSELAMLIKEQSPEVFNEIIRLGYCKNISLVIGLIILAILILVATHKLTKRFVQWYLNGCAQHALEEDDYLVPILMVLLGTALAVACSIGAIASCCNLVTIWAAPRIYVFEQLKDLIM